MVALVGNPCKPVTHFPNQKIHTHPGPLGEVAELVAEDAGKRPRREVSGEGQAYGQREIVARDSSEDWATGETGSQIGPHSDSPHHKRFAGLNLAPPRLCRLTVTDKFPG